MNEGYGLAHKTRTSSNVLGLGIQHSQAEAPGLQRNTDVFDQPDTPTSLAAHGTCTACLVVRYS
jgi:hypothetical protein